MTADEEPDEWTKMRRAKWRERLIVAGVIIAILGVIAVYTVLTTTYRHTGETCKESKDCTEARGTCLISEKGSFCTTYCEKPKDCAKGYTCQLADQVAKSGGRSGFMSKVCVPE